MKHGRDIKAPSSDHSPKVISTCHTPCLGGGRLQSILNKNLPVFMALRTDVTMTPNTQSDLSTKGDKVMALATIPVLRPSL